MWLSKEAVRANILSPRHHNLRNGPVMADEIDDKSAPQVVADALIRQKIADVKKIARMLAVKGGDDFSCVKIGKRDDLCLRKTKGLLDVRTYGSHFGIEDAAAKNGSDFDLDLSVSPLKCQLGNDAFRAVQGALKQRLKRMFEEV